jgi:exodeoxyribonuclease VII large subunit
LTDLLWTEARTHGGAAFAALTVTQLTRHLQAVLEADDILADVWVRGELSNLSRPASGHLYFALKDAESCLSCAMWRSRAGRLAFRPDEGTQVLARGRVEVYERRGQYQLIVEELQPDGIGALYLALEQLKRKLEAEGLFEPERKRPLPLFPQRVGIVTSPSGAAIHDLCSILQRGPCPPGIVLIPATVQGEEAASSLAAGIALANLLSQADVLIVGRGGGSAEDLWPFNSELVVRAIAASRIPVITAIGHETDFTLADFVADERCPTPTAAAELIVQLRLRRLEFLAAVPGALAQSLTRAVERERMRLELVASRRGLAEPQAIVERRRQWLDDLGARLARSMERLMERQAHRLTLLGSQMDSLSPLAVLSRGFARVVRLPDEVPVRRLADVAPGGRVRIALQDGTFDAAVLDLHPEAPGSPGREGRTP